MHCGGGNVANHQNITRRHTIKNIIPQEQNGKNKSYVEYYHRNVYPS